jgi:hypothetical protein
MNEDNELLNALFGLDTPTATVTPSAFKPRKTKIPDEDDELLAQLFPTPKQTEAAPMGLGRPVAPTPAIPTPATVPPPVSTTMAGIGRVLGPAASAPMPPRPQFPTTPTDVTRQPPPEAPITPESMVPVPSYAPASVLGGYERAGARAETPPEIMTQKGKIVTGQVLPEEQLSLSEKARGVGIGVAKELGKGFAEIPSFVLDVAGQFESQMAENAQAIGWDPETDKSKYGWAQKITQGAQALAEDAKKQKKTIADFYTITPQEQKAIDQCGVAGAVALGAAGMVPFLANIMAVGGEAQAVNIGKVLGKFTQTYGLKNLATIAPVIERAFPGVVKNIVKQGLEMGEVAGMGAEAEGEGGKWKEAGKAFGEMALFGFGGAGASMASKLATVAKSRVVQKLVGAITQGTVFTGMTAAGGDLSQKGLVSSFILGAGMEFLPRGRKHAEDLRRDPGLIPEAREVGERGEADRGGDIQLDETGQAKPAEAVEQAPEERQGIRAVTEPTPPETAPPQVLSDAVKTALIARISDRKARLQERIADIKDPQNKIDVEHESLDEHLGEWGVTSFKDANRTMRDLDKHGIEYSLERDDGRNINGANKALGHEETNEAIKKVWGEVWAKEIKEAGGIPFRGAGADELMVLWPGKTKAEVEPIRARINENINAKIEELRHDKIPHFKQGGLPTGAFNLEYGISDYAKEGNVVHKGDMNRNADHLAEKMKEEKYSEIAAKTGFIYNRKTGLYEHRGISQEKPTAAEPPISLDTGIRGQEGQGISEEPRTLEKPAEPPEEVVKTTRVIAGTEPEVIEPKPGEKPEISPQPKEPVYGEESQKGKREEGEGERRIPRAQGVKKEGREPPLPVVPTFKIGDEVRPTPESGIAARGTTRGGKIEDIDETGKIRVAGHGGAYWEPQKFAIVPKESYAIGIGDKFEHQGRKYGISEIKDAGEGKYDLKLRDLTGRYPVGREIQGTREQLEKKFGITFKDELFPKPEAPIVSKPEEGEIKPPELPTGEKKPPEEGAEPAVKPEPKPPLSPLVTGGRGAKIPLKPKVAEGVKNTLVNKLSEHLKSGKSFKNTRELLDIADEVYGGTVAEGKYGIRDAYDALETAMNKHLEQSGLPDDPKEAIKFLNEQQQKLPTQTVRTQEQIELQQFSTPPSEAYLVAKLTGVKEGMKALEPSAGTGNIATMMKLIGGNVHVNEIAEGRRENLKILGFEPTAVNAEYLNSTLPEDIKPDVVGMNPPFSSTGGRLKTHDTGFGAEHVRQALLRLKPGGRLVAIVGKGMAFGKPKMAPWWSKIMKEYTVRANVGISGKEYTKYGTGFDNQIIVIDKIGPTKIESGIPLNVIAGQDLTVEQAYDKLKPLIGEDVYERIEKQEIPSEKPIGVPVVGAGVRPIAGGGRPETPPGRGAERIPMEGVRKPHVELPERGGEGVPETRPSGEIEPEKAGPERGGVPVGADVGRVEREPKRLRIEKQEEKGGVYARYQVKKAVYKGSKPHPAKISESIVMASVELPDVKYELHIPEGMIKSGALSDVQLEAVTYACQIHEQRNVDKSRKEFLLGDGTGLGKSREILGVIAENFALGRKKALWITKSKGLITQIKNDMAAMQMNVPIFGQEKYGQADKIKENEGILLTTYSTAATAFGHNKPRYNQIREWLGDNFDGALVFDESHLMKNVSESKFVSEEEKVTALQEGSLRGRMGVQMKKDFPEARIVNASATAATTPTNLAYLTRMGLWGEGTSFPQFVPFLNAVRDGGVAMMEMISRDLKSSGNYLSRTISYDGVEYDTVNHPLAEHEIKMYDTMADFWATMLKTFEEAAETAGMGRGGQGKAIMKQFGGAQQRFFLQLMMSFQVDSAIKAADKDLEKGESVVISLYNTNESQTERKVSEALANGDDIDMVEFSPKDMMADMVEKNFPIHQYEEYEDENGVKGTRLVTDPVTGEPLINRENLEIKNRLIEQIKTLKIPDNPLDKIIDHFGENKVAEITGRKKRLIRDVSGRRIYKSRAIKGVPQTKINQYELDTFMNGNKKIAIISGAAATGFDLHASLRAKNQNRRNFYALQLSWSADEQMQAFGRVHRTEQKSAPVIKLVQTNIASQKRLVNAIQGRLATLGAMTKGGRETLSGGVFGVEDITDEYGEAALEYIYNRMPHTLLERMNLLGKEGGIKANAKRNVNSFLNRLMVLPFDRQNHLFDEFYEKYKENVAMAKALGKYDMGVTKVKGENIKLIGEPVLLNKNKESGVETRLVSLQSMFPTIRKEYEETASALSMAYPVQQKRSGKYYLVEKRDDDTYAIYGPRGHKENIEFVEEFQEKYEKAKDEKEAIRSWNEELAKIPEKEPHIVTMITGSILPVYDKIFVPGQYEREVKRAVTEKGESYIGVVIAPNNVARVKRNFGIGSELYKATPQEILDLLKTGSIIQLDNGWEITQHRVQGQNRIEIDYKTQEPSQSEIKHAGVFAETIQWTNRYFIPTDEEQAIYTIGKIMELHKPVSDLAAKKQSEEEPDLSVPVETSLTNKDIGMTEQEFAEDYNRNAMKEYNETVNEYLLRKYCQELLKGRNNFKVGAEE